MAVWDVEKAGTNMCDACCPEIIRPTFVYVVWTCATEQCCSVTAVFLAWRPRESRVDVKTVFLAWRPIERGADVTAWTLA